MLCVLDGEVLMCYVLALPDDACGGWTSTHTHINFPSKMSLFVPPFLILNYSHTPRGVSIICKQRIQKYQTDKLQCGLAFLAYYVCSQNHRHWKK